MYVLYIHYRSFHPERQNHSYSSFTKSAFPVFRTTDDAAYCSMLQHRKTTTRARAPTVRTTDVAAVCSILQYAAYCSMLHTAAYCSMLTERVCRSAPDPTVPVTK